MLLMSSSPAAAQRIYLRKSSPLLGGRKFRLHTFYTSTSPCKFGRITCRRSIQLWNKRNLYTGSNWQKARRSNIRNMSSDTEKMEKQMVIRELVPGVTTLSVPFSRGGLVKFGGRATIGTSLSPTPHIHASSILHYPNIY
jgi:hypothetical protein